MAITLGTNLASLRINNSLNLVTDSISSTMDRLSSGLKINSAKDDAAGLVISQNMQARIQSSEQAMANIQTAEAFLTIAEDGMVSITEHLQRINDLLTNMANDSNDVTSRTASANEIIERLDEINRLSDSTEFNGRAMLDGSTDSIIVQLGPDSTENSILEIAGALSDCHTSAAGLNCLLPDNLNPKAFKTTDDKVVYRQDDGKYLDEDGNEVTVANPSTLESLFDPTNENCRSYMQIVQDAITKLSGNRGLLGAYENRLSSSYDSLSIRVESLKAGQSVYTDTDIAKESTRYANQQILQQVNVSLLAQANSLQQLALSLIGG